ncbi:MAG: LytR C-terminal domain-containing protein [Patescibacteria group bacterium]|nr:LytR C-terminal domain-containing protein [Patescibacteria group bacterium]
MNKALINTILSGGKKLFVVALIVYLVGFLLEITFPGFISNNFNLNWVLGGVLVLGVLAALAPEEESPFVETTGDLRKADYLMFAGMGIIGGLLMFYKSDLDLVPRILFSLFVAGFIMAISIYLLTAKDEDESEESGKTKAAETTAPVLPQIRRFMARPVKMPLGVVVIGLILLGLGLIRPKNQWQKAPVANVDQLAQPEEFDSIALFLDEYKSELISQPSAEELNKTAINILNGSTQVGSASAMAKFLKTKDFTIGRVEDADNSDYKNAIIRFKPEEMKVAEYLVDAIVGIYPIVERAPAATDSAGIVLILGNL